MLNKKSIQPCGVANLLSAVFGKPLSETFPTVGLKLCPWCDEASAQPNY